MSGILQTLAEIWRGPRVHHLVGKPEEAAAIGRAKSAEILNAHRVSSEVSGDYRSAYHGQGLSFSELREYQPGDDPRTIHWGVTARFGKPYVKLFHEERQLQVLVLLDLSPSVVLSKQFTAIKQMAQFLLSVCRKNNDSFGLATYHQDLLSFTPPTNKRNRLRQIQYEIEKPIGASSANASQDSRAGLPKALDSLVPKLPSKTMLFVLSDFEEKLPLKTFKSLAGKYELRAIAFYPAQEQASYGFIRTMNPEKPFGHRSYRSELQTSLKAEHWDALKQAIRAEGGIAVQYKSDPRTTLHSLSHQKSSSRILARKAG